MSGGGWQPEQGFQWQQPAQPRRRRWWLIVPAVVVVMVVAAGAVLVWRPWRSASPDAQQETAARGPTLLSSPMRQEPVPGWRLTAEQVGLPAGASQGNFIGAVQDRAYFVTMSESLDQSYVYGVDTSGKVVLPATGLGGKVDVNCQLNGPTRVVCINNDVRIPAGDPIPAWVVDVSAGTVLFAGTTALRSSQGSGLPYLRPAGQYLLETHAGEGVYGLGDHLEKTWFVPGYGLAYGDIGPGDYPRSPAGYQVVDVKGDAPDVVFSLGDGSILTPRDGGGDRLLGAQLFDGGFGYDFQDAASGTRGLLFFDNRGKQLARVLVPGQDLSFAGDNTSRLPIAKANGRWLVFRPDGQQRVEIADDAPVATFDVSADTLFYTTDVTGDIAAPTKWQTVNLDTGARGPDCAFDREGYIGTDGTVMLSHDMASNVGITAVDLATCTTLWTRAEIGAWRVADTLIAYDGAGKDLVSLVAP